MCFTQLDSNDPLIWVLALVLALALIGGVLLLAALVTFEYRKRRQRSLMKARLERTVNEKTIETKAKTTTVKDEEQTTSENQ